MSDVYGAIIAAELAEASREGRRGRGKADEWRGVAAVCCGVRSGQWDRVTRPEERGIGITRN